MIVLGASRLSYEIGDKVLLKDVSVTIQSGDKVGVVGVNGSGKTTLFRLLAGEISPSDGEIYLGRDKKIGFLHQNDAFQSGDFSGSGDETLFSRMISAFPDLLNTEKRLSDVEKRLSDPKADPSLAEEYAVLHARFVSDDFCLSQYRRFVRLLFEPREKAILWHCTAGKDRTGTGALIIQEMLGVGREDIMADYLITNVYLKEEVSRFIDMIAEREGGMDENAKQAMFAFMGAHEKYPLTVYAEAEARYGSFDAFIRDGLGVTDAEREALRQRYLE